MMNDERGMMNKGQCASSHHSSLITHHSKRAYPAYKPSGVEWLGDVPEHWEVKALKRTFRTLNGATPTSGNPEYWDGDIPWATPDDLGSLNSATLTATRRMITREGYANCGVTLAPEGSLILSTRAPIGHLAIAGIGMCTNQGCRSLVFRSDDNRHFFFYQLLAARPILQSLGQGSTFTELSRDRLTSAFLVSPPLDEQRAIAAFLDSETARIDMLIEKKQRQIELLQEKRSALISHAVTKGLNSSAPMKDSGFEWLGKIPAHWQVLRFKRCIEFLTSGPRGWAEFFSDNGELFVRIGNLTRDSIELGLAEVQHVVPPTGAEAVRTRVRAGDVLVSITADLGSVAVVPEHIETAYISQHIALARPISKASHPRWLGFSIFSDSCRNQLRALGYGGTKVQLGLEDVQNLVLCLPPRDKQDRIVAWLDSEIGKLSMVIQKVQDSITTLREYRTALISAAVTGKIDVRKEAN